MKHSESFEMRFWKNQTLLVVSPHPDDEVYGCGATMAKAKAFGARVYLMIMSVGDLRFYEKKSLVKGATRVLEVAKVARMLKLDGVDIVYEDNQKHMRLDAIPRRDLIAKIEQESPLSLNRIHPTIMAIPAPSYNQDHEAVYKACFTAARIHAGGQKSTPDTVLVYDSPTLSWNHPGRAFQPNFYVDVSRFMAMKRKLVHAYQSQKRDAKDPCSIENIEDLLKTRGREVGRGPCEGFMAYRLVV